MMLVVNILRLLVILDLADMSYESEPSVNEHLTSLILSYETKYCKSKCLSTPETDIMAPFPASDSICTRCSCDAECRDFGDCCPDLYIGKGKYDLECVEFSQGISKAIQIYVVTQCSLGDKHYSEELSRKCNTSTQLPVSLRRENVTSLTFRNKYCAQCHGYEDFQTWDIGVACEQFPEEISHISDPVAIFDLLEKSPLCIFEYRVPQNISTRKCHEMSPISECNVTGIWKTYNASIEAACHAYSHVTNWGYQNIFCHICNEGVIYTSCCVQTPSFRLPAMGLQPIKPLIGLLQFEESNMNTDPKGNFCPRGEYQDTLTDQCRRILCPPFQQLKNRECLNIFTQFQFQTSRYFIRLYLVPVLENHIDTVSLTELKRVLTDYYTSQTDLEATALQKMVITIYTKSFYINGGCNDIGDISIADISRMEITIYVVSNFSIEYPFATFGERLSNLLFGDVCLHYEGFNISFRAVYKSMLPVTQTVTYHTLSCVYEPFTIEVGDYKAFSSDYVKRNCPQILYGQSDYTLMANASVLLNKSKTLIAGGDFTVTNSSDILVCLSTLEDLTLPLNDKDMYNVTMRISSIGTEQSYTLTSLSTVCIFFNIFLIHL
ncbi:uncharacterized protein [Haliotis cracherodii]|uniref:uncharacterized protein n=1 Tax=Haliotis cracherodii TaxID=6455 RepID=UPI0039EA82A3